MSWREAGPERRAQRRHPCDACRPVSVRVRPGHIVMPIDLSPAGVLVESEHPMRPGALVDVQIAAGDRRIAMRGRVVRCAVSKLRLGRVWYRAGISFDMHHPWLTTETQGGYALPITETRPHAAERGEAAR
jgi:hypothetical protein